MRYRECHIDIERNRKRERERCIYRERQTERERERDRERQTERDRERQTETDRERQRERETETETEEYIDQSMGFNKDIQGIHLIWISFHDNFFLYLSSMGRFVFKHKQAALPMKPRRR